VDIPLVALMLIRFGTAPSWHGWASLSACVLFGLGASSSAIFLLPMLAACLGLTLLLLVARHRALFLVGTALALAPLVLEGLWMRALVNRAALTQANPTMSSWQAWFDLVQTAAGKGSVEILWVLMLPLLAILLTPRSRRGYPLIMPVILFLTFGNPLLARWVWSNLTSSPTYYRTLWLYPVGVGLAVSVALLSRLAEKTRERFLKIRIPHFPLLICGVLLAVWCSWSGRFVWSPESYLGPFMAPQRAENPEKMPADLRAIAEKLVGDPDIEKGTILCGEEVSSFLTGYSRDFRFVVTRPLYTVSYLARAGRSQEAIERFFCAVELKNRSYGKEQLDSSDWFFLANLLGLQAASKLAHLPNQPQARDLPRLFRRYHVRFMILSPLVELIGPARYLYGGELARERETFLRTCGYYPVYPGKTYSLWKLQGEPKGAKAKALTSGNDVIADGQS